jgi:hypothetical protein
MKHLPRTEGVLAVRTDFSDDRSWKDVCAAIREPSDDGFVANLDIVSDPDYAGLTADQVLSILPGEPRRTFAFLIDSGALSEPEHPVLVVDLRDEPGRTFRVIPSCVWAVENNLSIANMDFAEFAEAVDVDGIFRGWE